MDIKNSIWRRFQYYGIGFIIGLIFVVIFFQNRGCAWLPANRVKNTFLDKVLILPDSEVSKFKLAGIDEQDIISFLNDGKVNFGASIKDPNVFPKSYVLEQKIHGKEHRIQISLYEDSYIAPVHYLEENDEVQLFPKLDGKGSFLRIPRDSALVFIDSKSSYINCKASELYSQEPSVLIHALKETGRIDFSKSNLMLPKAEHLIEFQFSNGQEVKAKTIWFESRISFKDFFWPEPLPCENN